MFGLVAQAPLIEAQGYVQSAFSTANFFFEYFVRKNRQGGDELLNCYKKWYNCWLRFLTMLLQGRICIALGPWHFGDFCNIFLRNIGVDQKKSLDLRAGPPAGIASYYGKYCPG